MYALLSFKSDRTGMHCERQYIGWDNLKVGDISSRKKDFYISCWRYFLGSIYVSIVENQDNIFFSNVFLCEVFQQGTAGNLKEKKSKWTKKKDVLLATNFRKC